MAEYLDVDDDPPSEAGAVEVLDCVDRAYLGHLWWDGEIWNVGLADGTNPPLSAFSYWRKL